MKAFIDRFVYFNCPENRAKIRSHAVGLAIPLEEDNPDTAAPVVDFFRRCVEYLEMRLVGSVIAHGVGDKGDILKRPEKLEEARLFGRSLIVGVPDPS
jgi:hypothetical protein